MKETTEKIEAQLENLEIDEMEDDDVNTPVFCSDLKTYYSKGGKGEKTDEDQYIDEIDDLSDEDNEDYTIHKDDNLILCTSTEDGGFSTLEVYIFNGQSNDLYVHHDIVLSAYPLCVEWLPSYQNNNRANYAIVGTFLPEIEIWNLDVLDAIDPDVVLGDSEEAEPIIKNIKSKKNKMKQQKTSLFHTDAVMALNLNPFDK
jgi:periodic tryptophan protein 1